MNYNTREAVAALAEPDAELAEYIKKNGMPSRPAALSTASGNGVVSAEPKSKNSEEVVINIPMRDGFDSEIRIHKPTASPPVPGPLIVLIYGGGFIGGNNLRFAVTAKALVQLYGATVVNLSYRLAPTYKFPTAPHDVFDTLLWVSKNLNALDVDPSKGFIIGGSSAGANLAATAVQKWLSEKHSPAVTGVWLNVPSVLTDAIVPDKYKELYFSREQNANALVLNKAAMDNIAAAYQPDIHSRDYSPFNYENAHKGMPRVYFQVCGADPLRDDGLVYEKVLRDHGVTTRINVYPGLPHGLSMFVGLKSAHKANIDALIGIAWLLGKKGDEDKAEKVLESLK